MKEKTTLRRAERALAARESGLPPGQDRAFVSQVRGNGAETDFIALPVIPAASEIQNEDGTFLFMVDFSVVDGPDPIG